MNKLRNNSSKYTRLSKQKTIMANRSNYQEVKSLYLDKKKLT